jgi:hypothetical protein
MITANVLTRVLRCHIKNGDSYGTGYTISVDDRQYLVTAKHMVEGTSRPLSVFWLGSSFLPSGLSRLPAIVPPVYQLRAVR